MERNKRIIKISIQGIIVNLVLVIFKALIGVLVNSIAIILDAVNNLSDALSAIITIIGAKLSEKAPDKEHPYGHGRIEYCASAIIGITMLIAGGLSLKECIEKVIYLEKASYTIDSLMIIAVAVIVKFLFGRYVKNEGKEMNCKSLIATGTEALMDSVLSLSTLIAAVVSLVWDISLESYLGLIISLMIIKSSIDILKGPINSIIGIRVERELAQKIKERINDYEEVEGTCDLILHDYGPSKIMGSVNIQISEDMNAREIHQLTKKISYDINKEFDILLTIGIYATNRDDKYKDIKDELNNIIEDYKEISQLHGFYVDEKKMEIYFDLIIDFKTKNPQEIKYEIIKKLKERFPYYKYYVILDTDLSC